MLAALAAVLAMSAGPRACAAERRLNVEQLEQKLDQAAFSPPAMRRGLRGCLAGTAARRLGLTGAEADILPDVDGALALGRSDLFAELADRLRDLCPDPAFDKTPRPRACGAHRAHLPPWPNITPIDQSEQGFKLWRRVEPGRAGQLLGQELVQVHPIEQAGAGAHLAERQQHHLDRP